MRSARKSAAATSSFVSALGDEAPRHVLRRRQVAGDGARPPIRASSARRLLGPERRAEPLEAASASSRVVRAAPRRFARRCVRPSASSVRAWWNGSVLRACCGERVARSSRRRPRDRRARRGAARGTARGSRAPRPVERARALLPRREHLVGLVELADGDQRLEQVAQLQAHSRLEQEVVAKLVRALRCVSAAAASPVRAR